MEEFSENKNIVYVARGTSVRFVQPRSAFTAAELDRFIEKVGCSDVELNPTYNISQEHLDEVFKCKNVRSLRVVFPKAKFEGLLDCPGIEKLICIDSLSEPFDFSEARSLKYLGIEWNKNLLNLSRMNQLETLYIHKFKGSLSDLESINQLKAFSLYESRIKDLGFLESYSQLTSLKLGYLRILENIDALFHLKNTLQQLELSHLPKLENYHSILSEMSSLRKLQLDRCKDLQDLDFIPRLQKLKFFSFVDMKVLSNDITPCMNLEYVGFGDRRSYNCTWDNEKRKLILKNESSKP